MAFDSMWSALEPIGRQGLTGGYRRFAWTKEDSVLREWFAGEAIARRMDLVVDRSGNQWAWWGDPDRAAANGSPGVVIGSHLDSVPDGGAFDGALGVVMAFAVVDRLRRDGCVPSRPIGIVNFVDEEGARFGVACAGSRLLTGTLSPEKVRMLTDSDGISMAEAMDAAGHDVDYVGRDPEALRRIGCFVELHVEQGRALAAIERPVAVASSIWPHGRWRLELHGEANHAGTTRLDDRVDPMLGLAEVIATARHAAYSHNCVATIGKVHVAPNGVNSIPSKVTAWLDARGPESADVRQVVAAVSACLTGDPIEESFTPPTIFEVGLRNRLALLLDDAPVLATGAGHDAGILASVGVPSAMLFVRNPTGVSHSPSEYAEYDDCLLGLDALTRVVAELSASPDELGGPVSLVAPES